MSVKFKVGFTISGETLFALMSKMLPIEDLEVEELSSSKTPLADRAIELHHKNLLPQRQKKKRFSPGPNFKKGINGIVLTAMKDKPLRTIEMQSLVKAAGFSLNSVNSRLERLREHGIVERVGDGRWRLKDRAAGSGPDRSS